MKQKLALCCALVHRPEILLLDEPTTGVDAVSRREFWDLLHRLKASGLTIVVSTPYMDEADRCDRVGLMQRGTLLAIDTPGRHHAGASGVRSSACAPAIATARCSRSGTYPHARTVYPFGETLHYTDARSSRAGLDRTGRATTCSGRRVWPASRWPNCRRLSKTASWS